MEGKQEVPEASSAVSAEPPEAGSDVSAEGPEVDSAGNVDA